MSKKEVLNEFMFNYVELNTDIYLGCIIICF